MDLLKGKFSKVYTVLKKNDIVIMIRILDKFDLIVTIECVM